METVEIDFAFLRPDRVDRVVRALQQGGLVAMPTDTAWVVACDCRERGAVKRLSALRERLACEDRAPRPNEKPMSLMCPDMTTIGTFALVDQPQFRLLRRLLPGPYTVILPASREVPRLLQTKRRAVGVRIPDHPVTLGILEAFGAPLLVTTAHTPGGDLLASSTEVVRELGRDLAMVVDTDPIVPAVSTVVDYTSVDPVVIREGRGPTEPGWA